MEAAMWVKRLAWSFYLGYNLIGQKRRPFRSLHVIKQIQRKKVQRMVKHAYQTVPYYKETMKRLGLAPEDFSSAEDLAKLPLLEREQLQRDPDYFLSTLQPKKCYLKLRSGGSSGAPCTVYHDAHALFQNAAHGERERSIFTKLVGKSIGYRETVIASPLSTAAEVQSFCQNRGLFPSRAQIERQYLSLLDPPQKNLTLLNEFKPDIIQSYGSYLDNLFAYIMSNAAFFQCPKLIAYSSDGLSESTRKLIEQEFRIPVFSTYQAIEAFKMGFECESHHGLHLNIDLYPIRIVDQAGKSLPDGESGNVVVSNLVNRATVLLNYRLGDMAQILPEKCSCGRTLPRLSFLQGRIDDWLEMPSGKMIHPQAVCTIFTNETEVLQYQVVQKEWARFKILVMSVDGCNRNGIEERLEEKFDRLFEQDVVYNIEFVDSIKRTPGGKVRTIMAFKGKPEIAKMNSV